MIKIVQTWEKVYFPTIFFITDLFIYSVFIHCLFWLLCHEFLSPMAHLYFMRWGLIFILLCVNLQFPQHHLFRGCLFPKVHCVLSAKIKWLTLFSFQLFYHIPLYFILYFYSVILYYLLLFNPVFCICVTYMLFLLLCQD